MSGVSELRWLPGSSRLSWHVGPQRIELACAQPPRRVVVLDDRSGIVVVEEPVGDYPRNAVILNADGSERYRLGVPSVPPGSGPPYRWCYDDVYFVGDELTLIVVGGGADMAVVVNPASGERVRTYETR